jgi:hypothetical protein
MAEKSKCWQRVSGRHPTAKRPRHFLFVLALFLCGPLETLGALRDNHLQKLGFEGCQFLAIGLFGITRKPLGYGGLRELGFERERTATR